MKNVLSILTIAILFIATSCSKESKLNRKLDGKWTLVTANGVAATFVYTLTFAKDKKGGSLIVVDGPLTGSGTYVLTADKTITTTVSFFGTTDVSIYTVTDYSKKDLSLTAQDGSLYKFTKN